MKTRMKFISSILMLLIIATMGIWAQTATPTEVKESPESPTNIATRGLVSTEADQFMNVLDWSQVKFDKVFTYAGFQQKATSPTVDQNLINLGAAFKAGPVYIGSWYQGKLGAITGKKQKTEKLELTLNSDGTKINNKKLVTDTQKNTDHSADHNLTALVGFGNIGINLGYARTDENKSGTYYNAAIATNTNTENSNDPHTISKTEYSDKGFVNAAKHGTLVGFGMNIALGKMTLSPKASLNVDVVQDSHYGLETATSKTGVQETVTKTVKAKGEGFVKIGGKAGVGLSLGDAFNSTFDFTYDFDARIFNKVYTDLDKKKHKVKGIYTVTQDEHKVESNNASNKKETRTIQMDTTEKTFLKNTITVDYKMQKDLTDRVSLFAGAKLPLYVEADIQVETTGNSWSLTTTTPINPSDSHKKEIKEEIVKNPSKKTNKTTIVINPEITAAVSYAAVPNRLFLNLGTKIAPFGKDGYSTTITKTTWNSAVKETTTITTYPNKYKPDTKTVKVENTATTASPKKSDYTVDHLYKTAVVELNGGLRWNVVENFAFDLVYTQSLIAETNIDLLKLSKLQLACTIKF